VTIISIVVLIEYNMIKVFSLGVHELENYKKTSKIKIKNRIRVILIIVCSIVFLFSSIHLTIRLVAYSKENSSYEKIRTIVGAKDRFTTNVSAKVKDEEDAPESMRIPYKLFSEDVSQLNSEGILKYYEKLKKLNEDMIGWISMPGYKKDIDYPVMQADDNDFYLFKDFYKNDSHAGSIFIDAGNQIKNVDRHIIIYGHSMFDMSMFGNLRDYPGKKEEYTKNKRIFLDFMNTRLEYEVFSTYYVEASFNYRQRNFSTDEEYMTFLKKILKKSVYDYGIALSPMDKIITLSTCNGDIMFNGRSVVHARLISQIRYDGFGEKELIKSDTGETKKVVSANVYLEKLYMQYNTAKIRVEAPVDVLLDPVFNTVKSKYTATLPIGVEEIILTLKAGDPQAKVSILLNDQKVTLPTLKMVEGSNTIKVKVTSRDGKFAKVYTINIKREPASE
jgi:sortase B